MRSRHPMQRCQRGGPSPSGFTLMELVIGATLLAVVLASVSQLLINEVRSSRTALSSTGANESIAQAASLIREEIADSSNLIRYASGSVTLPSACTQSTTPSFVLEGPGDAWRTAYGVRAPTAAEARRWKGPNLLVRCGLPYRSDGSLDTNGAVSETVLADQVASANALSVTSTGGDSGTQLIRDLSISIGLGVGSTTSFSARSGVNRMYGVMDRSTTANCAQVDGYLCAEPLNDTLHFWPTGSNVTVTGDDTKENAVYFKNKIASYTISNPCNSTSCTVTGSEVSVTITKGDLLVFADAELRP